MRQEVVWVHTDFNRRQQPHAILVFCWLGDGIVWVEHASRGWEVPGGKVEPGESPEEAARREVWEEAGITVQALTWIGEYGLSVNPRQENVSSQAVGCKWVYMANVYDIGARRASAEISDVCVFRPLVTPDDVAHRPEFSYVMKDSAFSTLWPVVLDARTQLR